MTTISKNFYYDVLDDIFDEYNNTYHKTIKMRPTDVKNDSFAEYHEKSYEKILNSKLAIMLESQSTRIFLLKDMLLIGVKKYVL